MPVSYVIQRLCETETTPAVNQSFIKPNINQSITPFIKMTASHLFQSNCLSPRIHLISLSSRVGASEISIIMTENGHCQFSNFPAKDRHPSHFSNLSCQGWTPVSLLQFCLSKTDTHLISPTSCQGQTPSHFSNSPWHRWTPISLLQLSLSRTDTHLTSSVKVKYPSHFFC